MTSACRHSDIQRLEKVWSSNWGRQTTNRCTCRLSPGSESRQRNDKHRIGVVGFPQFFANFCRFFVRRAHHSQGSWVSEINNAWQAATLTRWIVQLVGSTEKHCCHYSVIKDTDCRSYLRWGFFVVPPSLVHWLGEPPIMLRERILFLCGKPVQKTWPDWVLVLNTHQCGPAATATASCFASVQSNQIGRANHWLCRCSAQG